MRIFARPAIERPVDKKHVEFGGLGWSRQDILDLPLDELDTWMDVAGVDKPWQKLLRDIGRRSAVADSVWSLMEDGAWQT